MRQALSQSHEALLAVAVRMDMSDAHVLNGFTSTTGESGISLMRAVTRVLTTPVMVEMCDGITVRHVLTPPAPPAHEVLGRGGRARGEGEYKDGGEGGDGGDGGDGVKGKAGEGKSGYGEGSNASSSLSSAPVERIELGRLAAPFFIVSADDDQTEADGTEDGHKDKQEDRQEDRQENRHEDGPHEDRHKDMSFKLFLSRAALENERAKAMSEALSELLMLLQRSTRNEDGCTIRGPNLCTSYSGISYSGATTGV